MMEITQPYRSVRRTYSWGHEWLFSGNRGWKCTALSSLYQLETRKIPVREEAIRPSEERNRQWRSCVRKNSSVFARGWTNNRKDAKFQCVGVQQLVEPRKMSAWGQNHQEPVREEKTDKIAGRVELPAWVKCAFFLSIQKSTMGGVCMEAWTDKPATPLPKQLTAITSLSYQQKLLTEGGWDKTKEDDTWVFPPFGSRFDKSPPPHPYPWENHAPFDLVAATVAGCVHLINYRCIFTWWPT